MQVNTAVNTGRLVAVHVTCDAGCVDNITTSNTSLAAAPVCSRAVDERTPLCGLFQ